MSRHTNFTQAKLTRAIRAARDGGIIVVQVEIEPNGKIVLVIERQVRPADVGNPWDVELR